MGSLLVLCYNVISSFEDFAYAFSTISSMNIGSIVNVNVVNSLRRLESLVIETRIGISSEISNMHGVENRVHLSLNIKLH